MRPHLLLAATLAFAAPGAGADTPSMLLKGADALIAYKDNFAVELVDRTSDQCLPKAQTLKTTMETLLEAEGFSVVKDNPKPLGDKVVLSLIGYGTRNNQCVLYVESWLNHWLVANVPYAGQAQEGGQAYISARHPLGQSLHYAVRSETQALGLAALKRFAGKLKEDIDQSRAFADKNFPAIGREYGRIQAAK